MHSMFPKGITKYHDLSCVLVFFSLVHLCFGSLSRVALFLADISSSVVCCHSFPFITLGVLLIPSNSLVNLQNRIVFELWTSTLYRNNCKNQGNDLSKNK